VGGGRFDLLVPLQAEEKVLEYSRCLSKWLLEKFQGELAVLIVTEPARRADFADARHLYQTLETKLEFQKQRKWGDLLSIEQMALPRGEVWHICKVCQLTPMEDSGQICDLCQMHEIIGKKLPHTQYLAYCYIEPAAKGELIAFPSDSPIAARYIVFATYASELEQLPPNSRVIKLNQTKDFILPRVASSFRFLANFAPIAGKDWEGEGEEKVTKGNVLHFEAIAKLSNGAERIGVLKADVDLLGLMIGEGLTTDEADHSLSQGVKPTLSRVAALSRMLELFFAGHLNRICHEISLEWASRNPDRAAKAKGIFYILYSGGDDLFVVGPWDWVLELAERIEREFADYTGCNPSLTLSAGYIQVKPRYPIQKAADLVDEAEKVAKGQRNQICAFNVPMSWNEFRELLRLSRDWSGAIERREIPSGFIYDLGSLFRQHSDPEGRLRPLWTPQLYYTLARRLKKEAKAKYQQGIFEAIRSRKVLFPISITSLTIRERSR
ncbi:MAG: type III-A CRISPR-associated protein Cas10/Csm1, partial [Candidatus Methanomethylicaceae archaeon]